MAAPIRKVAPNAFIIGPLITAVEAATETLHAAQDPGIHTTLSTFGAVVSSTAPGSLHRAAAARSQIRRLIALK